MCEAQNKPNDIFENSNIIITVEKNIIEVFEFSQKNVDNKITNNLKKISEIKIDNNNNNNNNNDNNNNKLFNIINSDNDNSDNEILCIGYAQIDSNSPGFFICGHSSGLMSLWRPDPQQYLQKTHTQMLHNGPINKILFSKLSDNNNYLISCSSDKTVKVYSVAGNNVVKTENFEDEVMDVRLVNDFNKKSVFIISLKNGKLLAMNENIELLFEIPSRFNTTITRHVIPLKNPNENNTRGDLLAITESGRIDIFAWIKEGSNNFNNKKNNNPHNTSHKGPHNGPQNGPHNGPQIGSYNTPHNGPYNVPHNNPHNNNQHFQFSFNQNFMPRRGYY